MLSVECSIARIISLHPRCWIARSWRLNETDVFLFQSQRPGNDHPVGLRFFRANANLDAVFVVQAVGGTYMTLLNTFANFANVWPKSLVFFVVDKTSTQTCDEDGLCQHTARWSMRVLSVFVCNGTPFNPCKASVKLFATVFTFGWLWDLYLE